MHNYLARLLAGEATLPTIGAPVNSGFGPFGDASGYGIGTVGDKITKMFSNILGILTLIGALWFIIQLVVGAFKWMTSGGDKSNVEQAKEHFTHAIISLGILVAAYVIAALVSVIFGVEILNPTNVLQQLKP